MFFQVSQALAWFLEPANWLFILEVLALSLLLKKQYRAATWSLTVAVALSTAFYQLPLAGVMMRPLEQAFQQPILPTEVNGIIVLGGAEEPALTEVYGKPQLNGEAERLTEFIALSRKYPAAKLVYSSGPGSSIVVPAAEVARRFFRSQGVDSGAIVFEKQSRNTYESAVLARELAQPRDGKTWVLITSASHMPRAYGAFRKAGWNVIPYPVSYRAMPTVSMRDCNYETLRIAVHEWVGLAAYHLMGKM